MLSARLAACQWCCTACGPVDLDELGDQPLVALEFLERPALGSRQSLVGRLLAAEEDERDVHFSGLV